MRSRPKFVWKHRVDGVAQRFFLGQLRLQRWATGRITRTLADDLRILDQRVTSTKIAMSVAQVRSALLLPHLLVIVEYALALCLIDLGTQHSALLHSR
jgi:hypothetical protein